MRKRIVSLLLVTCMVLSTFVGCGKKDNEETSGNGSGKLSVGLPQSGSVTNYDENGFTLYFKKSELKEKSVEIRVYSVSGNKCIQTSFDTINLPN